MRTYIAVVTILLVSLSSACSQDDQVPDIPEILSRFESESFSLDVVEQALPRLTDQHVIFRLRGGDPTVLRGGDLKEENNIMKCVVVGAYFAAIHWDWKQYMYSDSDSKASAQLKFVMEYYLVQINHRLKEVEAQIKLLERIDELKKHFFASEKPLLENQIKAIDEHLESISKELQAFILANEGCQQSFAFGKWLVWQAELANLCMLARPRNASYIQNLMQQTYTGLNLERGEPLLSEIFGKNSGEKIRTLMISLSKLDETFRRANQDKCKTVRETVNEIFDVFELRFPSLK